MLRLVKMAVYGLLGYAIYEFIRGLTEGNDGGAMAGRGQGGSKALKRALNRGQGRTEATRQIEGEEVVTGDAAGHSVRHKVGRGVVSR